MSLFIRKHAAIILAASAGIALGTTATVILHRFTCHIRRELALLLVKLESLRREIAELRAAFERSRGGKDVHPSPTRVASYESVHASSGEEDEDDEFEEAYDDDGTHRSSLTSTEDYYSSSNGPVTPLDQLLPQVDRLLEGNNDDLEKAYNILTNCQHGYSNDVEFVLRLAKATYKIAQLKTDEEKQVLCYAAHDLASQALSLTDNNASVHKWFSITLGAITDFEPLKSKILKGYTFREHINKAMELDPDDYSNYHLCGRWCYSVYMLSWVERSAAAALIASPPTSTAEEALDYFIKAEDKSPDPWKENRLYIAKCYIEKRDYGLVAKWLDLANEVPSVSPDDYAAQVEIDSLLYSYSGYRS